MKTFVFTSPLDAMVFAYLMDQRPDEVEQVRKTATAAIDERLASPNYDAEYDYNSYSEKVAGNMEGVLKLIMGRSINRDVTVRGLDRYWQALLDYVTETGVDYFAVALAVVTGVDPREMPVLFLPVNDPIARDPRGPCSTRGSRSTRQAAGSLPSGLTALSRPNRKWLRCE